LHELVEIPGDLNCFNSSIRVVSDFPDVGFQLGERVDTKQTSDFFQVSESQTLPPPSVVQFVLEYSNSPGSLSQGRIFALENTPEPGKGVGFKPDEIILVSEF